MESPRGSSVAAAAAPDTIPTAGETAPTPAPLSRRWFPSVAALGPIVTLQERWRLSDEVVFSLGDPPTLGGDATVVLSGHLKCGVNFPLSSLLCSLFAFYGIQLYHLAPNSVVFLSVFVHL